MKKLFALVLVLGLVVALSACDFKTGDRGKQTMAPNTTTTQGNNTTTSLPISKETIAVTITREQAIDIALQAAGLTRDAVYDLEAELDRGLGGVYWEVDFETREYDYSYDIDAESGEIVRSERDRD